MTGSFRTLGTQQLAELHERALNSPRRRVNLNLHEGDDALIHRFLVSMCPDSYIRPHRHNQQHKLEAIIILQGDID